MRPPGHRQASVRLDVEDLAVDDAEITVSDERVRGPFPEGALQSRAVDVLPSEVAISEAVPDSLGWRTDVDFVTIVDVVFAHDRTSFRWGRAGLPSPSNCCHVRHDLHISQGLHVATR